MVLLEEQEIAPLPPLTWARRVLGGVTGRLFGLNYDSIIKFSRRRPLARLNEVDLIVATTPTQGLALAFLRAIGRLRTRILFIPMGVMPLGTPPWRRAVFRWLFRHMSLSPISRAEVAYLTEQLGPGLDIEYLPFGVDNRFWTPAPEDGGSGGYVLSIGNDWRRDYATLAEAWRPEYPPLKIVTHLQVPASDGRIKVIAGDWRKALLSDVEVRDLFQKALFVVLPIRQTIQPAGQSACLQAMACSKAVVLSDIAGLWNREEMVSGKTCLLTPPGSVGELRRAVESLLDDPARAGRIGARARAAVDERLNVEVMAKALKRRLEALS